MSSILFLDPTIPDYQSLLQGLNADTQLVILDPTQDGILQITAALKSGIFDTVHIVSHGTEGNLQLGTAQLNSATLPTYSSLLQQWSNYLTPGADILLYGCNVAQGDAGKNFVQQLHQATGADIAASDDATGSVVLGGDWNLEYSTGTITAPLAFQVGVMEAYNSVLAPFTAGDLVVLQVGDGKAALSSAATAVSLKEFNTTDTNQSAVNSIALPTADSGSNQTLTQSGTAASEGALNLSADGRYLTLVGYDATPGTANVTGTTSATTNRIVARIDALGIVDTTTRINNAYSANNIRSAVTNDGSGFWVAGPSTGLTFVSYGSAGTSTTLNALNSRVVNIFNGQLYTSSGSGSNVGVNTVGTGLPNSGNQATTLLSGLPNTGNPYAYVLLDRDAGVAGLDTLYIADQTSGLFKYSFNGTTWTARGNIAGTLTGLTGVINGSNVDLYATNGTSAGNSLVKVTDTTAFNANLSGTFTTLATAPTNTIFKGVAFAPVSAAPANPTVNLSVSPNTGTEAAQTSITVTATASSAVTSDQTVTLTVSGTNITTGDYTLNNTTTNSVTITILSGQTTGTATFKVVDDVLAEGDEIAVLTISNPSSGITLGTATQNITITDNDVIANTAPTIFADNETVIDTDKITPFLSLPNNSPTATPTALVSGVIGDSTDPAKTIGIEFNVSDAETAAGALTVTATSSNQSVVTDANLTVTQSANANSRNLKINPTGVGYSDITVTVSDGSLTSSYVIKYAASAAGSTTTRFLTGAANASTAIVIDSNYMLVGDDENQALRLYNRNNSGLPVASFDFTSSLNLTDLKNGSPREVDIEASAKVGNRIFWLGSQSNNDPEGNSRPNRDRIFGTDITGTGSTTTLSYVGRYDFLREDIIAWDVNNGHGLGANFFGLSTSAASGKGSKQTDGYNIEGLEFAPDNTTAYVAFRAPQEPTASRTKALIVPIINFTSLLNAVSGGTQGTATFGAPIQLDLGGRGIREIRKNASNQYVIIAGPAGDATGVAPADFRLYTWTGVATDAPVLRTADLTALNAGGSFESIVEVPSSLTSTTQLQLLVDNGSTVFYNDGLAGSDIPDKPNFQKSHSEIVTLGSPVGIAPTLSVNNVSLTEGNSGTTPLGFTVSLSAASSRQITVNYATVNDTAYAGYDFNATSGTLTFAPGETTKTVNVDVIGDTFNETNETFKLQLSNPTNAALGTSYGTGTIIDDDAAPSLSVSNISVAEGNSGSSFATFNVRLSAASGQTVTVNYATADGTATVADNDYISTSGTLSFAPGNTLLTVNVPIVGDTKVESNENFYLNFSNPNGATLANSQAVGTILDDDANSNLSLSGTSGNDILTGGSGNDNIFGLDGNDILDGGAGNDRLTGGLGADILTGGLGTDTFIYNNFNESLFAAPDRIRDFNPGEGDRIVFNNLPTATFNAGIITAANLTAAVAAAYSDADPITAGSQALAANQAVFFSFGTSVYARRTYLSVNDNIAGWNANSDLFIEVTGLIGSLPTGSLNTSNYFFSVPV